MDEKISAGINSGIEPKNQITERAGEIASAGLEEAKNITSSVRDRVYREVDSRRQSVAGTLDRFAEDLDRMGSSEDEEDVSARVAGSAAKTVRRVSRALSENSTEELLERAGQKIRERPGLFLGACLALGFAAGRLLRAGNHE